MGIDPDHRFDMDGAFVPAEGAAGWSTSTSPILSLAALAASLAIFDEVGMPALRRRSVALTGDLERRLRALGADLLTPRRSGRAAPSSRSGSPIPRPILAALAARGVIADIRAPDIVRLAPMPFYNTFHDGWRAVDALADLL